MFQVTVQNKRQVLGDVIYLIRFPNMDADDFIRSVSSAEVLTTEESLSLILLMKGSTPKKELAFSSVERSGAWTEEFFKDLSIVSQSGFQFGNKANAVTGGLFSPSQSSDIHVPFQVDYGKNKAICIKSVFLINNTNCQISKVSLWASEGKISTLKNRTYVGCQLYEAVFNPKVIMQPNPTASVFVKNPSAPQFVVQVNTTASIIVQQPFPPQYHNLQQPLPRQSTLLQGQRTIGAHPTSQKFIGKAQVGGFASHKRPSTNTTITMQSVPWHFVVGFKYKTM